MIRNLIGHWNRAAWRDRVEVFTVSLLPLLAFVMVPLTLGVFLWELDPTEAIVFEVLFIIIWIFLAVAFILNLILAKSRIGYIVEHPLELLFLVLPFARVVAVIFLLPFAVRKSLTITRLFSFGLAYLGVGVVSIGATLFFSLERTANANVSSFADAAWWVLVTITTVGYGDVVPETVGGRIVAVFVMIVGIGIYGGLAGYLASILQRRHNPDPQVADLTKEVRLLRDEITKLASAKAEKGLNDKTGSRESRSEDS